MRNRVRSGCGLLAAAAGLIALAGCTGVEDWSPASVAETQLRGDRIAAALNNYRQDEGEYPTSLDALVPTYLSEVPPPTAGNGLWGYESYDRNSRFRLWFEGTAEDTPVYIYDSTTKKWAAGAP